MREVFEHPAGGRDPGEQRFNLRQGRRTATEYALTFRTLTAQTNWVEDTLKLLFRQGLSQDLQSELACRDEGRNFEEFVAMSIRVDNLVRSRRPVRGYETSTALSSDMYERDGCQRHCSRYFPFPRIMNFNSHHAL